MKLKSFSITNYRSITRAEKVTLSDYSILLGANNEGKSNILDALALAMNILINWQQEFSLKQGGMMLGGHEYKKLCSECNFNWKVDHPIEKQNKSKAQSTSIGLEFELDEEETKEFKVEIRSKLNEILPILLSFTKYQIKVTVNKPGRGQISLNKKSHSIAKFISKRIRFEYIPATRTTEAAQEVIDKLVEKELCKLENQPEYKQAIKTLEDLQRPFLDKLGKAMQGTISNLLPNVKTINLEIQSEARSKALLKDVDIVIGDGHLTKLERKGAGVTSLVALALIKHSLDQDSCGLTTILAIEEPETHLHSLAIRKLRIALENMSGKNQIVLTTHSPLLVNRRKLSNISIVSRSKVELGCRISRIREVLGVCLSDNLKNAEVVLLVEGSNDKKSLASILPALDKEIGKALSSGTFAIVDLGGVCKLSSQTLQYLNGSCQVLCFIDNDVAAKKASSMAQEEASLQDRDIFHCNVPGMAESEMEDLFNQKVYCEGFEKEFGVVLKKKVKGKKREGKWSIYMEQLFRDQGRAWVSVKAKAFLASCASEKPAEIVHSELRGPLSNLIGGIKARLSIDP